MYCTTYEQAKKQAIQNADYFGVPYVVFRDVSWNYQCERFNSELRCHCEGCVFLPGKTYPMDAGEVGRRRHK